MITTSLTRKNVRATGLACIAFLLAIATAAQAENVTLQFDTLPSEQGWDYSGAPVPEDVVFIADGSKLLLTTMGAGDDATASYEIYDIVNSDWKMTLSFTVRILDYENLAAGGGAAEQGLRFEVNDDGIGHQIVMTDGLLQVNGQSLAVDTGVFHDYVLDVLPDGSFEFFVDSGLLATGDELAGEFTNKIIFGDSALDENMDAEITALSFTQTTSDINVQKSVNNSSPMVDETVEFTIQVSNGGDLLATDVLILDQLPPEMAIPAGSVAVASVGSYDPVAGEWLVGDLAVGSNAVLTVPAVVTEPQPPECIVNTASSDVTGDLDPTNDVSRAAIHQAGVERCVDLDVEFGISVSEAFFLFPECDVEDRYSGEVEVTNHGPDAARNVVLTMSKDPARENLRFDDADCSNAPAAECNIAEIAAGETVTINVTSDLYQSPVPIDQSIFVGATTSDVDYDLSSNNPSASGRAGGFSSCENIDLGLRELSSSAGGCFIATAAYGAPLGRHLESLRGFRDRHMITNGPGRAMVRFYYRYSPPLADFIAERDWLRAMVRGLLTPIVYTIEYPLVAAIGCFSMLATFIAWRRRRARTAAAKSDHQALSVQAP